MDQDAANLVKFNGLFKIEKSLSIGDVTQQSTGMRDLSGIDQSSNAKRAPW